MSNCYCCLFCESWCKVTANERNGKRNCFLLHFRMPRKLFKVTANERNGGRVKTPNINNKKLVVRSCVDVQRVFVFLQKRAL